MKEPSPGVELIGSLVRILLAEAIVIKLMLFCVLLVVCWPAALLALVLYPLVWLVLLPFRLIGIVVGGVFDLIEAVFMLPVRVLRRA